MKRNIVLEVVRNEKNHSYNNLFFVVLSFPACQDTYINYSNVDGVLSTTDKGKNYSLEEKQEEVDIKYGTYILTDMYVVSNGMDVDMEYMQTQYVYLEKDIILWYALSGALWTCKNYDYSIVGNKFCCTPVYNNGLVDIEFVYDEDQNEIIYEANDVRSVFSYYSEDKPVGDDEVVENV